MVGPYHDGVALRNEDLEAVHLVRHGVLAVRLDHGHLVVIDAEVVAGVTRNVDETEPVAAQYPIRCNSRRMW